MRENFGLKRPDASVVRLRQSSEVYRVNGRQTQIDKPKNRARIDGASALGL